MEHSLQEITYIVILLLASLHIITSVPAKPNSRPVHEIINEQSRIDEKIRQPIKAGNLPYGNPLAGNSRQNAKLHAQNQQAMFNAERVRQHRAQLQRWTKAPPQVDSYMKAYHESQESHQLALEQQQAKLRDNRQAPVTKAPVRQNVIENGRRPQKVVQSAEPTKITKADAVTKSEKNRNHRSYGSVEYHQHLQPKRYQTVYVSPAPTYDQGVTIKPNGNVGLTQLKSYPEEVNLYTKAIPSKTEYVYPKQYSQMQSYQSSQDIDHLNALLKKTPNDQLSELSALLNSNQHSSGESYKDTLNTPIDLYFYLKDKAPVLPQHYDESLYAQISPTYASAYMPEIRDHTPIIEDIDDIEDPNKNTRLKTYGVQAILATQAPEEQVDTTTTKSNNYYKVEVASQTISAPYNPSKHYYYKDHEEAKPTYQALHFNTQQPKYYSQKYKTEGDSSERYLHHNAQHVGIHHLTDEGTGVSAYGDDNLHYAANYEFGYRVRDHHSGNDFGHHEAKKGDKTKGQYHVLLPDGRMQNVKYSAGPEGFHADISYDHLH